MLNLKFATEHRIPIFAIENEYMRPLQMVDTKTQYFKIKIVDAAVLNVMESSMFIGGKVVNDFAINLAGYNVLHVIPAPMVQMHYRFQ
jgi:hypothetical protein